MHVIFALIVLFNTGAQNSLAVVGYFDSYSQCQKQAKVVEISLNDANRTVCLPVSHPAH